MFPDCGDSFPSLSLLASHARSHAKENVENNCGARKRPASNDMMASLQPGSKRPRREEEVEEVEEQEISEETDSCPEEMESDYEMEEEEMAFEQPEKKRGRVSKNALQELAKNVRELK